MENQNNKQGQQVTVKIGGGYISGHCIHVNHQGEPSEIVHNGEVYTVDGAGFFKKK